MSEWEMNLYYSFSNEDIEIINRHRRDYNRLGFAVQLCMLRFPGWPLTPDTEIPTPILQYIANQLDININEFHMYFKREATRHEHIEEIRQIYGFRNLSAQDYHWLLKNLIKHALENGNTNHLIKMAIDELRNLKIILPAISTIERAVWESRKRAEEKIFKMINACLSEEQKKKLDTLIQTSDEHSQTKLSWLKDNAGKPSPDTFMKIIERLEYIRLFNLNINTTGIHHNRLIQLARLGSRYEPHSFRRFEDKKKYAILVIFLIELSQDLIDQAIEIHDRQINTLFLKGRKEQEEIQNKNGKALNEKIVHFVDIGAALIKARDEGLDPFQAIENIMSWEDIVHSVEEAKTLARPIDYDYLDLLDKRYNHLRKYTPTLLKCLDFNSTESYKPVLKALNTINEMNKNRKRNVPDDACLDFISNRWSKHVFDSKGNINRHYYEMAALTELRNGIRSGDISVLGSRQHKDFNDYLVSKEEWNLAKKEGTRLAADLSVEEYLNEREKSLQERLSWITKNIDSLEGVNLKKGVIHINRLDKATPDEAKQFSSELYKMIPRVKLTDLLVEVSNWTKFDEQFTHASNGRKPKENEKEIVMATLIAMGTNIGLAKMADATPGISYHQMANVAQWRMYDDALNKAQATLVNFHHKLALPSYWGDGTTSSSDGMRVQIGVSSIHADANPHYGSGKGATIYRFLSDQFSSFYTKVINTNARDAVHVIDGLLHHETDLNIEEHYTDTAGYTDQVFGLSHLLGFRFAPRLRDISELKLYSFTKASEYPKIESILRGRINRKVIEKNYDDVLRLAHSIREGVVSSSLIMGKLGSYARHNKVSMALREMGRIEKTIFIFDYISNKALRRRIQKGLNKGEAANALARAIFFGKRGDFYERRLKDQLQRASALNIILNAISLWNTVYLSKAIEHLKSKEQLNEELLKHISPLSWGHINFYGEYNFNLKNTTTIENLRPLNI
jgi:TnpA family transposase